MIINTNYTFLKTVIVFFATFFFTPFVINYEADTNEIKY